MTPNDTVKVLKASAYYLEDVRGLKLDKRSQDGKISFILLNQPPICDSHCRRCFMPPSRRFLKNKNGLSLQESCYVLNKAQEFGALCLEISGEGEPVLSNNLPEIIKHAHKLGYMTTLITNGHNLTREMISLCKDSEVTLVFSHHSLNKRKYESDNCTRNSFDKKLKNIELAAEIYNDTTERVGKYLVYRIAIHATLQNDNINDALELKHYCNRKNIFFSVAPLAQTGCAIDHPDMKLQENITINNKRINILDVPRELGDNSIIHSHSSEKEIGREVCGTCFYGLNIGYDGALLFDAHAGYDVGSRLGNIRTEPFSSLVAQQKSLANNLFRSISGFCPVRDNKWPQFLKNYFKDTVHMQESAVR